jgi:N-acetylmuramoyl-L-alanine amidase
MVVIHCTELPDLQIAREYGERIHYPESGSGNSGHFYIEQNGRIEQWVSLDRVAHHVSGYNEKSIGIELDNPGRYPEWFDSRHQTMNQAYEPPQLNSLLTLIHYLRARLPALQWITGHENLDQSQVPASDNASLLVYRKRDPGPLFPWNEILPPSKLEFYVPEK